MYILADLFPFYKTFSITVLKDEIIWFTEISLTVVVFVGMIFTWPLAFVVVETEFRHNPPTSVLLTKQLDQNCKTSLASPTQDMRFFLAVRAYFRKIAVIFKL